MLGALNLKNVEDVIGSYEERIQSISSVFDNAHIILSEYQEFVSDINTEKERLRIQLRDTLAKNESLRKKDFDRMMGNILLLQDERENEVKCMLNGYLNAQREMATILRENLGTFKDILEKENIHRVREFRGMLKEILSEQEERKNEIDARLKSFQKEQSELSTSLKGLLARGKDLRIKDLKATLRWFEAQSKGRAAQRRERRDEVKRMLGTFKRERLEMAHNRDVARVG